MNPTNPIAQSHADAGSSERAAQRRIAPIAGKLRGDILTLVALAEGHGLTATEAYANYCEIYGEPKGGLYSVSPRLSELERQGYVRKGDTRDDRVAYVATAAGIAWAGIERAA